MKRSRKRLLFLFSGLLSGLVNGLFGGGGGMICLPLLRRSGLSQQQAAATTLGVMLPVSALSLLLMLQKDGLPDLPLWPCLLISLPGAGLGAVLLQRLGGVWLRRIFGMLLILSALFLFFR